MNFGELQKYTRQRTSTENNDTITDDELQDYLNNSLGELDNILVTDYEDYRITKYLATIQGGTSGGNQIPLPPDFLKLRAVDFGSPGMWVTIFGFGLQERNRYNNPVANMYAPYGNQAARKVRVMGNKIFVEPENISSGQYQIWYTPQFKRLCLPTDELDPTMQMQAFIEYAVASTGIKIYSKLFPQPGATDSFEKQLIRYEDMVRNTAKNRMSSGPKCVQNVRNISDWQFVSGGGWGA